MGKVMIILEFDDEQSDPEDGTGLTEDAYDELCGHLMGYSIVEIRSAD